MVKEKKPMVVFLMETKLQACQVEKVQLGFGSVFVVDSIGRSGGLALFWHENVEVEIQNYSRRHINAKVRSDISGQWWKFIGFMGIQKSLKEMKLGVSYNICVHSPQVHGCA
jgi:hypothetical protein